MPRVGEVDVGVPQPVQLQGSSGPSLRVGQHDGAVVLGLGVAATGSHHGRQPTEQDQDGRDGRRARPAGPPLDDRAGQHQQHAEPDQDPADRNPGDEHEPGDHGARDRAGGADPRQPADDRAGLAQAGQPQLGDHRSDRREQRPRHDDAERRHQDQHQRPVGRQRARAADGERGEGDRDPGDGQQRTDRAQRRDPVGQPTTGPRPDGDGGQRRTDDDRARLQRQPEEGSEQSQRGHLHHQHRRRGTEHQRGGGVLAESRRPDAAGSSVPALTGRSWHRRPRSADIRVRSTPLASVPAPTRSDRRIRRTRADLSAMRRDPGRIANGNGPRSDGVG